MNILVTDLHIVSGCLNWGDSPSVYYGIYHHFDDEHSYHESKFVIKMPRILKPDVASFQANVLSLCIEQNSNYCLQVIGQLLGEAQLPWEGNNLTMEQQGRLGVLHKAVLQLLHRDPLRRPPMRAFADKCKSLAES